LILIKRGITNVKKYLVEFAAPPVLSIAAIRRIRYYNEPMKLRRRNAAITHAATTALVSHRRPCANPPAALKFAAAAQTRRSGGPE
jgi:hypothetical protein